SISFCIAPPSVYAYNHFFFQAEDGIRDRNVTGVQTCSLPIFQRLSVPVQPAFGSLAPYTIRGILDWTIAPAHIGQGSSVTYNVQSSKRQLPIYSFAALIASNSACDNVVCSFSC